nr:WD-40 repeat-containing protein MSI4 [Tanacetum cinerariifolium]
MSKTNSKTTVVNEKYSHWKEVVPILYDWIANHNLVWPSLSCRWGPLLEQSKHKNKQRLYLSEQWLCITMLHLVHLTAGREPKSPFINRWPPRVTLGRLLPHAKGLGFKPRRGGFSSGAKKEWGLSPKANVRVLHTAQLDVT